MVCGNPATNPAGASRQTATIEALQNNPPDVQIQLSVATKGTDERLTQCMVASMNLGLVKQLICGYLWREDVKTTNETNDEGSRFRGKWCHRNPECSGTVGREFGWCCLEGRHQCHMRYRPACAGRSSHSDLSHRRHNWPRILRHSRGCWARFWCFGRRPSWHPSKRDLRKMWLLQSRTSQSVHPSWRDLGASGSTAVLRNMHGRPDERSSSCQTRCRWNLPRSLNRSVAY